MDRALDADALYELYRESQAEGVRGVDDCPLPYVTVKAFTSLAADLLRDIEPLEDERSSRQVFDLLGDLLAGRLQPWSGPLALSDVNRMAQLGAWCVHQLPYQDTEDPVTLALLAALDRVCGGAPWSGPVRVVQNAEQLLRSYVTEDGVEVTPADPYRLEFSDPVLEASYLLPSLDHLDRLAEQQLRELAREAAALACGLATDQLIRAGVSDRLDVVATLTAQALAVQRGLRQALDFVTALDARVREALIAELLLDLDTPLGPRGAEH
jgi:hypothetical protein